MSSNPKRAVKISIGSIIAMLLFFTLYSIITCLRENTSTEEDKARIILDAICITLNDYLEKNGSFPDIIKENQNYNTFAPILKIDVPYISGSSINKADIILTSLSDSNRRYIVSIKLHDEKIIGINEKSEFIE